MPIRVTSSDAASTSLGRVSKSRSTTMTVNASGLKPNSPYTLWCNGVDMTWACRTAGTKMGSGLTSDASGSISVLFSVEVVPGTTTSSKGRTKYNSIQLKDLNGNVAIVSVSAQKQVTKGH